MHFYVVQIPQLLVIVGGGYFVFPGASHNRFEHSIGYQLIIFLVLPNNRINK